MSTGETAIEELNQQVSSQTEQVMFLEETISDQKEDISAKVAKMAQLEMDLSSTQTSLRELEQRNEARAVEDLKSVTEEKASLQQKLSEVSDRGAQHESRAVQLEEKLGSLTVELEDVRRERHVITYVS